MFNTQAYLANRFRFTRKEHRRAGRDFQLTYAEYLLLIGEREITRIEFEYKQYLVRKRRGLVKGGFRTSHVLGWRSNEYMQLGIVSSDTMRWMTVSDSKRMGMIKGQKHSEAAKLKISKARTGMKRKPFTEEHKDNIRIAFLGNKQSPETIAKRKATWDKKRKAALTNPVEVTPEIEQAVEKTPQEKHLDLFDEVFADIPTEELPNEPAFITWAKKAKSLGMCATGE